MIEGSAFAKSIAEASWNQFLQYLFYKAAEAGRKIGFVNPAYTTQECCKCGYMATRDFNAAQNILALGLDGLRVIPRSLCL